MAAVAGILFTDAMGLPKWYEAGALDYDIPATAQLGVLFPVMGFLELKRLQGFKETGTVSCLLRAPAWPGCACAGWPGGWW
jgi:light-harvesting complex I chlorophyll a/b binding protein 5